VNTSLLAAGALRDAIGDVWLGVYRPTEAVPQHVEERDIGLRLDERDEAAAIRSAMLARPKASDTNPVSSPPALPPLRITAAQQAKESENFDIGQLTARALTGIGHSISQLLNPQEHVASTRITADFRGYVQRSTYLNQRASAIALQTASRGRLARGALSSARQQFWAAAIIQKWVRGFVDRQWAALVKEETIRLREAEVVAEADERYKQKTNRRDKVKRAFSFKRKQRPKSKAPTADSRQEANEGRRGDDGGTGILPTLGKLMGGGSSGTVSSSESALTPTPVSTPGSASIRRSFSWGRKSKGSPSR